MNALGQTLGQALMTLSWQAALIALGVALVDTMASLSARARYLMHVAALFSLPLLFAVAFAWPAAMPQVLTLAAPSSTWLSDLALAWAVGVAAMALYMAGGGCLVWSLRHRARQDFGVLPEAWRARMEELARRIGGSCARARLAISHSISTPCTIGWIRPLVLLPSSALSGVAPDCIASYLDALLAHELAHVRRYDYLVNLLQRGVETLFFFHPAVWWLSGRARQECEHCCDDIAIAMCGSAVNYARTLVDLAEAQSAPAAPSMVCAASGSRLSLRVTRILGQGSATPPWRVWMLAAGVIALAGLLLTPAAARPKPPRTRVATVATVKVAPPSTARVARLAPAPKARPASVAHAILTAPARPTQPARISSSPQSAYQPVQLRWKMEEKQQCAPPAWQWVRVVSSDGEVWMVFEPVTHCELVLIT